MPYEYRKLSAKDRAEIVEARRQRGYPLHSPWLWEQWKEYPPSKDFGKDWDI
jgi:hypothetical protein